MNGSLPSSPSVMGCWWRTADRKADGGRRTAEKATACRSDARPPPSAVRPPLSPSVSYLRHQGERIPLRIPEEHHPQIVIGHLRDQMWLIDELDAALLQRLVAPRDVLHLVVDHRARMIEARLLGRAQHEPHATAVEERQVRELEQKAHPERVTIELHGARNVLRADGDLSNCVECYGGRRHGHRRL